MKNESEMSVIAKWWDITKAAVRLSKQASQHSLSKLVLDHTQVHNRPVLIQTQDAIKSIPGRTLTHGLATDPC